MRCRHLQRHLLAFVEDELAPKKRRKVEAHVATCQACASAWRSVQHTLRAVRAMEVPELPAAVWGEFGAALHQRLRLEASVHPERRRFKIADLLAVSDLWSWPKPALAAVTVSLILVGSLQFVLRHHGQRPALTVVLSQGEEASLAADLDLLKHLDLLEEVDILESLDTTL